MVHEGEYYTPEFRQMALERMKTSSSISALAKRNWAYRGKGCIAGEKR